MVELLEQPDLRTKQAKQAKEKVHREFTREAFARKLLAFYDEIEKRIKLNIR
jgi:ribosomal protein S4